MPLTIEVPASELYNRKTGEFTTVKATTLVLEYSLVAISKWESKWEIPFIGKSNKTDEQVLDLVKFMTLTKHVDPNVYQVLTDENYSDILAYIEKPHTATVINERDEKRGRKEVLTAELIYYYMIANNIPKEFEKWHLNRLITLIRVCAIKNAPPKKRSRKATLEHYKNLNEMRRAKYHTPG